MNLGNRLHLEMQDHKYIYNVLSTDADKAFKIPASLYKPFSSEIQPPYWNIKDALR